MEIHPSLRPTSATSEIKTSSPGMVPRSIAIDADGIQV